MNEALCQELYRYVITPCFKLRENYNNDLAKDYEIREEIINSIQKILVVYTIQVDLFDTLMNLKRLWIFGKSSNRKYRGLHY